MESISRKGGGREKKPLAKIKETAPWGEWGGGKDSFGGALAKKKSSASLGKREKNSKR